MLQSSSLQSLTSFLEDKENDTASSVKYHKYLLKVKFQRYFSYMFRDCDTFSAVSKYWECAKIALIVLRETLLGELIDKYLGHLINPGECILYSAKIYAFDKQFKFDNSKIQNVHQICLLNGLIFVKVWLNAQNATVAPVNDLMLWKFLNL
ncbi:hypothetical protein AVEN_26513-1 [Araneus ventricosus]|uniref:Uncharacterized protein n=1 Tax=Araneus ventricosus TaxID=182803 RepID=A0A4Y2CUC2_ARAVE|nr:hypothetical protein AVEN_26513-1 [Araneus ventricosus]